jgi:hypothetical protein
MSAMAQGVTPSIGFVYQVPGFSEIYDAGAYQYSFVNRQIYRDFAVMSSLGVRVIKIPISISAVIDPGSAANNNWANQRIHINSAQFAMAQQAVHDDADERVTVNGITRSEARQSGGHEVFERRSDVQRA